MIKGSIWRHKVSGALYRVEEVADGEYLMGVERFSPDETTRIIFEAREHGVDKLEALEAARETAGFMVEAAWFKHAAVRVGE